MRPLESGTSPCIYNTNNRLFILLNHVFVKEMGSEEELRLRISLSPINKDCSTGMTSEKTGLRHPTAIVLMIFWYIFSAFNLFANKYVISYLKGDPALLGDYTIEYLILS